MMPKDGTSSPLPKHRYRADSPTKIEKPVSLKMVRIEGIAYTPEDSSDPSEPRFKLPISYEKIRWMHFGMGSLLNKRQ